MLHVTLDSSSRFALFMESKTIFRYRKTMCSILSAFIWDFEKVPFPQHFGKYFIKIREKSAKIHGIGKIEAIL